ncbi:hypothetical protein CNBG_9462 [Cryptococcus deuterogattii R265]|nr:hypothetical protein CNBG_9462 [Cryptococcus deuterogattii R265]
MHSKFFQTSSRNGHQRRLPNTSLQDIPTGLAEIIVDPRDKGKCRLWDSDTNPDEKAIREARDAAAAEAMAAAAAEGAQVNAEELDVDMPEALPANLPGANRLAAPLPNGVDIRPTLPLYDRLRQLDQERADGVNQIPAAQQHANVALNIHNGRIR